MKSLTTKENSNPVSFTFYKDEAKIGIPSQRVTIGFMPDPSIDVTVAIQVTDGHVVVKRGGMAVAIPLNVIMAMALSQEPDIAADK